MGAAVDCEAIGSGLLGQPVNSLSSLALVVAGLFVLSRDRWVAGALAATGIGSFLFHGPLAPGGEWIHDVTLAWLILVVALRSRGSVNRYGAGGLAAVAVVFFVVPSVADTVTVALVIVTLLLLVSDGRRVDALGPVALLAVSAIVGRLGATGGTWCDPGSMLQTHALWHAGAAVAVGWWAIGYAERNGVPDRSSTPSDAELS
jgi:hypothetical protein